jgi:hypothetical protein
MPSSYELELTQRLEEQISAVQALSQQLGALSGRVAAVEQGAGAWLADLAARLTILETVCHDAHTHPGPAKPGDGASTNKRKTQRGEVPPPPGSEETHP